MLLHVQGIIGAQRLFRQSAALIPVHCTAIAAAIE